MNVAEDCPLSPQSPPVWVISTCAIKIVGHKAKKKSIRFIDSISGKKTCLRLSKQGLINFELVNRKGRRGVENHGKGVTRTSSHFPHTSAEFGLGSVLNSVKCKSIGAEFSAHIDKELMME